MKSKVFIGSSVEGLKIAYAIQQNLRHNAETTVWDQGVFELSSTSIESLIDVLDNSDFGIFVFSPDDIIKIRGVDSPIVRDNVLFELGLFIGRLGRKRAFIVIPEGADIKLPTDLLGITPGKYEVGRSDNSDQAATGPTSHQIRLSIEKYGPRIIEEDEPISGSTEHLSKESSKEKVWIDYYLENKFEESIKELDKQIKKEKDAETTLDLKLWKAHITWTINPELGDNLFRDCIKKNKSNSLPYLRYINILMSNDLHKEVIKLIDEGISNTTGSKDSLICKQAEYFFRIGEKDIAIEKLTKSILDKKSIQLYLKLVEINDDLKESHKIIHEAYLNYPTEEQILAKYAIIADKLELHKVSLFLLDKLVRIDKESSTYWTTLGNTYLNLDLYGKALDCYEKGNRLAEERQAWILGNIGNLYNNTKLYSKAIESLELSLKIDSKLEYAHNRLSSALKKKEEEDKKIAELIKDGRIELRNINFDLELKSD